MRSSQGWLYTGRKRAQQEGGFRARSMSGVLSAQVRGTALDGAVDKARSDPPPDRTFSQAAPSDSHVYGTRLAD